MVAEAGDPALTVFMRSSSKPLQALPLARVRDDLEARDLAIASASHLADDAQLAAVRALLAKAPAGVDELECGPIRRRRSTTTAPGSTPGCSPSAAAKAGPARATGWRITPSSERCWPRQPSWPGRGDPDRDRRLRRRHLRVAAGTDGCAFARFDEHIAAAMREYPELIRGPGALDTNLMRALPGWTAKGGAEGLFCAGRGNRCCFESRGRRARAFPPPVGSCLDLDGLAFGPLGHEQPERGRRNGI